MASDSGQRGSGTASLAGERPDSQLQRSDVRSTVRESAPGATSSESARTSKKTVAQRSSASSQPKRSLPGTTEGQPVPGSRSGSRRSTEPAQSVGVDGQARSTQRSASYSSADRTRATSQSSTGEVNFDSIARAADRSSSARQSSGAKADEGSSEGIEGGVAGGKPDDTASRPRSVRFDGSASPRGRQFTSETSDEVTKPRSSNGSAGKPALQSSDGDFDSAAAQRTSSKRSTEMTPAPNDDFDPTAAERISSKRSTGTARSITSTGEISATAAARSSNKSSARKSPTTTSNDNVSAETSRSQRSVGRSPTTTSKDDVGSATATRSSSKRSSGRVPTATSNEKFGSARSSSKRSTGKSPTLTSNEEIASERSNSMKSAGSAPNRTTSYDESSAARSSSKRSTGRAPTTTSNNQFGSTAAERTSSKTSTRRVPSTSTSNDDFPAERVGSSRGSAGDTSSRERPSQQRASNTTDQRSTTPANADDVAASDSTQQSSRSTTRRSSGKTQSGRSSVTGQAMPIIAEEGRPPSGVAHSTDTSVRHSSIARSTRESRPTGSQGAVRPDVGSSSAVRRSTGTVSASSGQRQERSATVQSGDTDVERRSSKSRSSYAADAVEIDETAADGEVVSEAYAADNRHSADRHTGSRSLVSPMVVVAGSYEAEHGVALPAPRRTSAERLRELSALYQHPRAAASWVEQTQPEQTDVISAIVEEDESLKVDSSSTPDRHTSSDRHASSLIGAPIRMGSASVDEILHKEEEREDSSEELHRLAAARSVTGHQVSVADLVQNVFHPERQNPDLSNAEEESAAGESATPASGPASGRTSIGSKRVSGKLGSQETLLAGRLKRPSGGEASSQSATEPFMVGWERGRTLVSVGTADPSNDRSPWTSEDERALAAGSGTVRTSYAADFERSSGSVDYPAKATARRETGDSTSRSKRTSSGADERLSHERDSKVAEQRSWLPSDYYSTEEVPSWLMRKRTSQEADAAGEEDSPGSSKAKRSSGTTRKSSADQRSSVDRSSAATFERRESAGTRSGMGSAATVGRGSAKQRQTDQTRDGGADGNDEAGDVATSERRLSGGTRSASASARSTKVRGPTSGSGRGTGSSVGTKESTAGKQRSSGSYTDRHSERTASQRGNICRYPLISNVELRHRQYSPLCQQNRRKVNGERRSEALQTAWCRAVSVARL